jgi:hypothetical protein
VLVKAILEEITVYWMSLAWILKGVMEVMRVFFYRFIWSRKKEKKKLCFGFVEEASPTKSKGRREPKEPISLFQIHIRKNKLEVNPRNRDVGTYCENQKYYGGMD